MGLSVSIVEDEANFLALTARTLSEAGFEVAGYSSAEGLLSRLSQDYFSPHAMPDCILVDLSLPGMKGIEFINEVAARLPSQILAVSGMESPKALVNAVWDGAAGYLIKPVDRARLIQDVGRHARIGSNRKQHRLANGLPPDVERLHRSVFLSYDSKDEKAARVVRCALEAVGVSVWYAGGAIHPGHAWRNRIRDGLTEALVFLPLVSEHFADSAYCISELSVFLYLTENDPARRLILPLLSGDPQAVHRPVVEWIADKHYVKIERSGSLIDDLNAVTLTTQQHLAATASCS